MPRRCSREASSGTIYWQNATNSAWAYVGINLGANWNYQGTGDVNHDGFSDVVIRDTSGLVYIANAYNLLAPRAVTNFKKMLPAKLSGDFARHIGNAD